MELIQETKNDKKNEGGVTLRDIVELVFDNWYWIVLSVVICMSVAWFYLAMHTVIQEKRGNVSEERKQIGKRYVGCS